VSDIRPTVIATVGPDLGLTPEERRLRRDRAVLRQEIRGTMGRMARIESKLLTAIKARNEPQAALFRAKLEKAKRTMATAQEKLKALE
jgi:hypothetical protein